MKTQTSIAILGAGESGVGAALLGNKLGYRVWVSDGGKISEERKAELKTNNLPFEEGGHTKETFFDADVIVKSPGIPGTAPIVEALRSEGKKLVSEIEFAFASKPGLEVIAITGSNGKTTTTALIHHLLVAGGLNAGLGGNIGKSFARLLSEGEMPAYVIEVSSFQRRCGHFSPACSGHYQHHSRSRPVATYTAWSNMLLPNFASLPSGGCRQVCLQHGRPCDHGRNVEAPGEWP
ncbi:MAG: Mur ligase family protein [Bacteroidia bacterium]